VPGVVRWPGRIQPAVVDEPVGFVDLMPTLCALAGAKLPDKPLDGVDVGPLLFAGKKPERKVPLYWQYDKAIGDTTPPWTQAIRRDHYKLLADATQTKFALYDLAADISEKADLSADPKHAGRLKALTAELRKMHADVNGKR
jgi:arylsulfatase A